MSRLGIAALSLLVWIAPPAAAFTPAAAASDPVAQAVKCAECGMTTAADGPFTARLVAAGLTRYFCDIGDLVAFIERTHPTGAAAFVRDYPSGEWVDAGTASYVIDKQAYPTPMGWGIAAFRDRAAAPGPALGFESLREALR